MSIFWPADAQQPSRETRLRCWILRSSRTSLVNSLIPCRWRRRTRGEEGGEEDRAKRRTKRRREKRKPRARLTTQQRVWRTNQNRAMGESRKGPSEGAVPPSRGAEEGERKLLARRLGCSSDSFIIRCLCTVSLDCFSCHGMVQGRKEKRREATHPLLSQQVPLRPPFPPPPAHPVRPLPSSRPLPSPSAE